MSPTDLALLMTMRRHVREGSARELRETAGLSRSEIAASVGVTASSVTKWELGLRVPTGEPALQYARVLDQLRGANAAGVQS